MHYAELEIAVQVVPGGSYTIDMRFRPEPGDLDRELAVNVPVRINKAELLASSMDASSYGTMLSSTVFADQRLREAWITARAYADSHDAPLRLRLRLDPSDPELHGIRWESFVDDQGTTLARSERLLFSRYLESADMTRFKTPARGDVTALVVVASPSNLAQFSLAPIDASAEAARITRALADIPAATLVTGSSASAVTLTAVIDALRFGYSILYLVCHGTMIKGIPYLALENEWGDTEWVPGSELAERIRDLGSDRRPNMVILASCQSVGVGQDSDAPAALGPQLARAGVAAVIGMQGNIPLPTVARLMPRFFQQLVEDGQVDRALAVARTGLRPDDPWWMPVLFLRTRDGRIWRDAPSPQPAAPPPPAARPAPPARPPTLLWAVGALALVAALAFGLFSFVAGPGQRPTAQPVAAVPTDKPTPAPPTATLAPTVPPTPTPAPPAPLPDGEYMVLVSRIEAPAAGRDLTAEILEDLRTTVEGVPFSNIRIASYDGAIASDEQARAIAAASRAAVVIWGGGPGPAPILRVRVGDLSVFPNIPAGFAVGAIRRTSEADLRLDRAPPVLPSAALSVLSAFHVLHSAADNPYEVLRVGALIERLPEDAALLTPTGVGSAALLQRYLNTYYNGQPSDALPFIQQALADDPANPIILLYSGVAYQRIEELDKSYENVRAAFNAVPGWTTPQYIAALNTLYRGFPEQALSLLDRALASKPDDLFGLAYRGAFYYMVGADDNARADLERAIELGFPTPLPHNFAAALALRQGRVEDARALLAAADERFRAQLNFDNRFWRNLFGAESIFGLSTGAFEQLNAGQNSDAIASATRALAIESPLVNDRLRADMNFIIGYAECRRGNAQASADAFDQAIAADPNYGLLYLFRAEARKNLADGLGAIEDLNAAAQSPQAERLAPTIQQAQLGQLTCQNAFESRP